MKYVDGYLIAIPKKNVPAYKKMAQQGRDVWMKHGALDYKECIGDDLSMKMAGSYKKLLKLKPSETVIYSFVTYKSRKHRDQVNDKVMKDPSMDPEKWKNEPMPFDMKRMFVGGFTVIVDV